MSEGRDKYKNLLDKIEQLTSTDPEFRKELGRRYGGNEKIDEIHELCVERIITEQAEKFYAVFPIVDIKKQLIEDYIRAERFKRKNNFEDFCLAVYQQVESIVNWFCSNQFFIDNYNNNKDTITSLLDKNRKPITVLNLMLANVDEKNIGEDKIEEKRNKTLIGLFFNERLKSVLYFVYFNGKPFNKYVFDTKYNEINELYQCRNLNHRGGEPTGYQENIIQRIMPYKYLYYLKFTGLLVDFVEKISQNYGGK
jgi:hypothetical protein